MKSWRAHTGQALPHFTFAGFTFLSRGAYKCVAKHSARARFPRVLMQNISIESALFRYALFSYALSRVQLVPRPTYKHRFPRQNAYMIGPRIFSFAHFKRRAARCRRPHPTSFLRWRVCVISLNDCLASRFTRTSDATSSSSPTILSRIFLLNFGCFPGPGGTITQRSFAVRRCHKFSRVSSNVLIRAMIRNL
jgi:hypothetical protein